MVKSQALLFGGGAVRRKLGWTRQGRHLWVSTVTALPLFLLNTFCVHHLFVHLANSGNKKLSKV